MENHPQHYIQRDPGEAYWDNKNYLKGKMLSSQQEEWYKPTQLHIIFLIRNADVLVIQKQGFQRFLGPVCLNGGRRPQIGEVTCGGSHHLSCKRDQIKKRDYMDRQVTPPKWVTSPTWGPPLPVNRP